MNLDPEYRVKHILDDILPRIKAKPSIVSDSFLMKLECKAFQLAGQYPISREELLKIFTSFRELKRDDIRSQIRNEFYEKRFVQTKLYDWRNDGKKTTPPHLSEKA